MDRTKSPLTPTEHNRNTRVIILGTGALILFLVVASLSAFNWKFLNPTTIAQVAIFTALSAVAVLLFLTVLILLARNLLKLYADGRSHVMGSRLRTRMLVGAILVSLVPLAFMLVFSYGLMNRAVDRWFTQPVTRMRDDSNRMALELSDYTTANARAEAEAIAAQVPTLASNKDALTNRPAVQRLLRDHQITLQGGFVVVFRNARAVAALNMPRQAGPEARVKTLLPTTPVPSGDDPATASDSAEPIVGQPGFLDPADPADSAVLAAARRGDNPVFTLAGSDFALGLAPLLHPGTGATGTVVVGLPLPTGMSATMDRLRTETDNYWALMRQRRSVRTTYTILLLMMTSLALFVSSWLALFLSKQITKPVEALADAMASIAAGNYSYRVAADATGELADLVRSFNGMAEDLEGSRAQVESANELLSTANTNLSARGQELIARSQELSARGLELEARRSELETMLQTIPNGVATLDPTGRIVLANRALSEMLDPGGQQPFIGRTLPELFPPHIPESHDILESLARLERRSHRMGSASAEMDMTVHGDTLNLLATIAILETPNNPGAKAHLGYVLVLENATELLNAQKQSAWKEVARRVAHEIKNPLTPISLNAEQIGRHINRMETAGLESPSIAVIRRCSDVISASVESMRGLVDQFSSLAQFPTAQPRPADLNAIIESSLALFAGRTESIHITRHLEPSLPLVLADPEAMKRALGNLIDNAVEAMQHALLRELTVATTVLPSGLIELTVADTGAGLTDDMRERLFLPYFSTKQRGTGLGLAIAAKIIQEHGGTIRAEKNIPAGARFLLELRPATQPENPADPTSNPAQLQLQA